MKPKNHFRYAEFAPGAIRPLGHLKQFLERQARGLTGHRERLGYPFDTTLWRRRLRHAHFTEGVWHGEDRPIPGADGLWWPYEQSGYLLDGMLRLSYLVPAPRLRAEYERNLRALLAAAAPDGHLGANLHDSGSEWPMAVFYKSVIAWLDAAPDGAPEVVAAFARHYASLAAKRRGWWGRDLLNIEGMLDLFARTGERALLDDALHAFRHSYDVRRWRTQRRILEHGVSFAESLKLPALVYRATGDAAWLRLGEKAVRDAFAENGQPSGQISANEFLSGRDPRQGYETCVASDMLWSLGYYAEAGGADACRIADRMERIAYNALPGALKKDFTGHQYLSAVNQVCATPFSNDTHFNFAEAPWRQYRPSHFPQCCTGNVNRALPVFAQRLWLRDAATGAPCAMLHGPSEVAGTWRGRAWRIESASAYPFEDALRFVFHVDGAAPLRMPFSFRVPGWARGVRLSLDGAALPDRPRPGTVHTVDRAWREGDSLEVALHPRVRLRSDRNWRWFERGALLYAYAVPSRVVPETPGDRFSPVSVEPTGPWNLAVDEAALRAEPPRLVRRPAAPGAFPFEEPPVALRVRLAEIEEGRVLAQNRFTPEVPLYAHPTGAMRDVELVPFGATLARLAAFPDAVPRTPLPILAAYASDAYDYDPAKPLRAQVFEPEGWDAEAFRSRPIPQRTPEQFFDLAGHFGLRDGEKKLAYLLFRFWSDRTARATAALGAANTAQVFSEGREVFALEGIHEGELMAPQWFPLDVRPGVNWLLVKVATPGRQGQYRREWGARLDVFLTGPQPR